MIRKNILIALLLGALIIAFDGCNGQAVPEQSKEDSTFSTESERPEPQDRTDDSSINQIDSPIQETEKTEESASSGAETAEPAGKEMETDETAALPTSPPEISNEEPKQEITEPPKQETTAVAKPTEQTETIKPSEPPKQAEDPITEASVTDEPMEEEKPPIPPETVQPAESAPIPQPTTEETTRPSEIEKPEAPIIDIDYWISYAQDYAQSIGLRLEESAVDCWDNPLSVNEKNCSLESDIKSRLDRYVKAEDITDVWIWGEIRADGSYNLYIGYA